MMEVQCFPWVAAKPRRWPEASCGPGAKRPHFSIMAFSRGEVGLSERGQDYAAVRTNLYGRKRWPGSVNAGGRA